MSTNLLLAFLLTMTSVYAMTRVSQFPRPMPGINVQALSGTWYSAFRKPPCSWSGSKKFTNVQVFFQFEGKKNPVQITFGYGNKVCSRVYGNLDMTPTPGAFILQDYFGDLLSGKVVFVATDYKDFFVWWGCTKSSVYGDICDDPLICVQTRIPNPGKKTVAKINAALMKNFGITTQQMEHHVEQNGACPPAKRTKYYG